MIKWEAIFTRCKSAGGGKARNKLAEGVGFEPSLGLLLSLISSQVPSTTQPPFRKMPGPARCAAFQATTLCVRLRQGQAHSQRRRAAAKRDPGPPAPPARRRHFFGWLDRLKRCFFKRKNNLPDGGERVTLSTVPLVCHAPPKQPACRVNVELACR